MDKTERINKLTDLLNAASAQYYSSDGEIMSDFDYDKLYDELVFLENENGYRNADSPTQRVGYDILSSLEKVRHEMRMLSLDKTKELDRLVRFLSDDGGQFGLLSYKLDGLTIVLTFENGTLKQAVTRGNGEIGEDITHNAKTFANLPKQIQFKNELILRGEAVITFSDFEKINESLPPEEKYKNPRNLCSGTVRQLNSEICASRSVCFFAFSLVKADGIDFNDKKSDQLSFLKEQGFQIVEFSIATTENIENEVKAFSDKIEKNDFATDGLVLTYESLNYSQSLGATSKFPKDSIAFKWKDETQETTLKEVEWNTSRTGLVNPVAVFEPVELEGTTVERASLHNLGIIKSLKLGIGDRINVYKANMIIPQISENLTQSDTLEIPLVCPECGSKTEFSDFLYCRNPNCPAQINETIAHYCSRDAMNIEGFSLETIKKFTSNGFLRDYSDIYKLETYADEIVKLEGLGKKSFDNLLKSIKVSKTRDLHFFVYALGINQIGLANAKLLCRYFGYNLDKIIKAEAETLVEIDGFGESIAQSVSAYFSEEKNIAVMNTALSFLNLAAPDVAENTAKLEGKVFVITGDVHVFKNRDELKAEIEKNGGKTAGSVSGKTSFLINNDNTSSSSKNKKAAELGVPVITEDEFIEMLR